MHAQLLPVSDDVSVGGGEDRQDHGLGDYSHFGEFQALMRKWINREVSVMVALYCEMKNDPLFSLLCSQYCSAIENKYFLYPRTLTCMDIKAMLLIHQTMHLFQVIQIFFVNLAIYHTLLNLQLCRSNLWIS